MSKQKDVERQQAIETLKELLKPGDTVFTVLRHVSRSGMSRLIDCYIIQDNNPRYISSLVAKACDYGMAKESIRASGCGMDMGFEIVYNLSRELFPNGFACTGIDRGKGRCVSNDHSNGDRDYSIGRMHTGDGGYALKQDWM